MRMNIRELADKTEEIVGIALKIGVTIIVVGLTCLGTYAIYKGFGHLK